MQVLILGGTAMLGREVARYAVSAGHEVTCVARGHSAEPPAGARFVRADRDTDNALAELHQPGWRWDVVIDVSRQPGQVRQSVAALEPVADSYVFVSSGNVYADHSRIPSDESAPLLAPLSGDLADPETYGEGKVACEQAVIDGFGEQRALIARAGLIGGPGDWSGRSGYWPWRFANPAADNGSVLVPDDPDLPMTIIDVRDLAAWLVDAGTAGLAGTFDAFGEPRTLGHLLASSREVVDHTGPVVRASPEWLGKNGVNAWTGPDSMPLWLDDPSWRGFSAHLGDAARTVGLSTRPLAETLAAAYEYEQNRTEGEPRPCGLSDAMERRLLAELAPT